MAITIRNNTLHNSGRNLMTLQGFKDRVKAPALAATLGAAALAAFAGAAQGGKVDECRELPTKNEQIVCVRGVLADMRHEKQEQRAGHVERLQEIDDRIAIIDATIGPD